MKKQGKLIVVLVVVILLLIVIGGAILGFVLLKGKDAKKEEAASEYVMIKCADGMYRFFDANGNKTAEVMSSEDPKFYDTEVARITNEEGKHALIDKSGNIIYDYGKYKYYFSYGLFMEACDYSNDEFLLNYKGDIICDLKGKKLKHDIGVDEFVGVEADDTVDIIGYTGKTIMSFPKTEYEFYESRNDKYSTIYSNGNTYVIDCKEEKIVTTIATECPYVVGSVCVIDDNKYILAPYSDENSNLIYSMVGSEIKFSTDEYENLFYYNNTLATNSDTLLYFYILDDEGNFVVDKTYDFYIADSGSYIKKVNMEYTTQFYLNNELVATVENTVPYSVADYKNRVYILKNRISSYKDKEKIDGTYSYYNGRGEKLLDYNLKKAEDFDNNNLAKITVSDNECYLINDKFEIVTKKYDNIIFTNYNNNEDTFVYLATLNNENYVLDKNGKEIFVTTGAISLSDNYFCVIENDTATYYNFNAKELYKE